MTQSDFQTFDVPEEMHKMRLDKVLSGLVEELSRSRLKALIEEERVRLNGVVCVDPSKIVMKADVVVL